MRRDDKLEGVKPLFLNDQTRASNPGRLKIELWRWLHTLSARQFAYVVMFLCLIPLGFLMEMWDDWTFKAAFLFPAVTVPGFYWRAREHFLHGDVNPAVVVSLRPPLLAVSADLSAGRGAFPVIKVLPHRFKTMTGAPFQVGDRLATVALYEGTGANGVWENFHPVATNAVTSNGVDISRVFASIPDDEWQQLKYGLKQIQSPPKPGLYPVDSWRQMQINLN